MNKGVQLDLFTSPKDTVAAVARVFEPARLTQARVLAGLTKKDLAAAVGVTPAAISQYESAVSTPRPQMLAELARLLVQDVGFFAGGRPLVRLDTTEAHFRSLRSLRAADRDLALATAEQIWELVCALERHIELPTVTLPGDLAGATPRVAAQAIRQHWQQDRGPIKHLVAAMETRGIVVLLADQTSSIERVDAFSTVIAERPIVMSTPRRSRDIYRHRFTCAHELGHLVMHQGQASGDITTERQADEFAAEFLTPAEAMKSLLPQRMDLAALNRLGQAWGVSTESLIRRMSELRIVSESTIRRAHQRLNTLRNFNVSGSIHNYSGETPRMLHQAIELTTTVGIGPKELAAELRWRPDRIHTLLGMDDPRPKLALI